MTDEILLLKYGEIALKGLNRRSFENTLLHNLSHRLRRIGQFRLTALQSTVTVETEGEQPPLPLGGRTLLDRACEECAAVFGFASLTRAARCVKSMESLCRTAEAYLEQPLRAAKTFKVESRRSDKRFPLTSPEISAEVGHALLLAYPHLSVDLHRPDVTVHCEMRDTHAFVHAGAQEAAGGIPVSVSGRGALLLSGGIDSPVAGYLMARRGLTVHCLHFHSHPYTSTRALQKVEELAALLAPWLGDVHLHIVELTPLQERMRDACDPELFTVLTRRAMMRIGGMLAESLGCGCLITGESLGQVASQTLPALAVTENASPLPVLRPLIGLDKEDIVRLARRVGTFEKSIEPYEDCCAIFAPKHPKTKPKLADVLREEQKLPEELALQALRGARQVTLRAQPR